MSKFITSFLTVALLSSFVFGSSTNDQVDWDLFSDNIKEALKSENTGLKISAMQHIIKYSDDLNVSNASAAFDVMREFKNNEDQSIRRLSLITLYRMNNDWAMESLKRQYKFEENIKIKHAINAFVLAYENDKTKK